MHYAPPAPDVAAEWQHCQFVRHAQEPRRVEQQEEARARFSTPSRDARARSGNAAMTGIVHKGTKIKSRRLKAPALARSDFISPRSAAIRSPDYFWMLA
jgi:hypothetical protein